MRGAAAERSQKIIIMEDGLLIGPAPYSAPAAYYFPSTARMTNVEVFKGPVGIQYGPNTVGGAINLVTASIPTEFSANLEAAYGSDAFRRLSARVGDGQDTVGWLIEAMSYGSDGFKDIDYSDSDTGFERNDVNLKIRIDSDAHAKRYQKLEFKLGFANEHSNETYLGLLDEDFKRGPLSPAMRRGQLDHMETEHYQLHISHQIEINAAMALTTRLYRNEFERDWQKFDNFKTVPVGGGLCDIEPFNEFYCDSPIRFSAVADDPSSVINARYYGLLTGERDSDGTELQKLDVTSNHREYVSQGLQFDFAWLLSVGEAVHGLGGGVEVFITIMLIGTIPSGLTI